MSGAARRSAWRRWIGATLFAAIVSPPIGAIAGLGCAWLAQRLGLDPARRTAPPMRTS